MNVLTTRSLTKRFRSHTALDDVNVDLERGKIYGFVGNNGAGKTTFMRMICGLGYPTSGRISLFGAEDEKGLQKARQRIGALIEAPVFYPDMTARQNLLAQSMLRDGSDKRQVDELLRLVGLAGVRFRRMRNFSTGMKQRYGLAAALLGKPELLILDEPLNGLDVEGMDEISERLAALCREHGMTILLSSHLLARLEGLATDYIFIDYGKIVECITAEELRAKANGDLETYFRRLVQHDVFGMGDYRVSRL
ncbi:ABC transporter ATP-binding protein [Gorillibacterium sp. sgz500922]|uniref:ABC transporter ATP-binding protein n=1 Tax=Gorillibacterium sp. sgz500922 TaxID=3446694 RepID=UPI003F678B7F